LGWGGEAPKRLMRRAITVQVRCSCVNEVVLWKKGAKKDGAIRLSEGYQQQDLGSVIKARKEGCGKAPHFQKKLSLAFAP